MKLFIKAIFIIAVIKTIIVSFLLVAAIILGVGKTNILLPGLGLVISGSFIIFLLLAAEIFLIAFTAFLWRYVSKNRLR